MRTGWVEMIGLVMCRMHTGSRVSCRGRHSEYSK